MKIRMKVTAAGAGWYYLAGSIVDLAPEQAELYIRGGYAEAIETAEALPAPETAARAREAETAEAVAVAETAAKTTAKKKKAK